MNQKYYLHESGPIDDWKDWHRVEDLEMLIHIESHTTNSERRDFRHKFTSVNTVWDLIMNAFPRFFSAIDLSQGWRSTDMFFRIINSENPNNCEPHAIIGMKTDNNGTVYVISETCDIIIPHEYGESFRIIATLEGVDDKMKLRNMR